MKQRRTIARKENFLTGEVIELEKFKPYKNARAVQTIELFDAATGKLIERTTAENFFSRNVEAIQKQFALAALLSHQTGMDTSGYRLDQGWNSNTNSFADPSKIMPFEKLYGSYNAPLKYVVLTTDDTKEEPEKETMLKGQVIGWADRATTYSGSSTRQGTINTSESYGERGHMHLVFDWPTHAANGTFNSVNFASNYYYNDFNYWLGYQSNNISADGKGFNFHSSNRGIKIKDGYLYFSGYKKDESSSSQRIYRIPINLETWEIDADAVEEYTTNRINYNDSFDIQSFDIAPDGTIWYTADSGYLFHFGRDGELLPIPGITGSYLSFPGVREDVGMTIVGNELWIDTGGKASGNNPILTRYSLNDFSEPLDVRELVGANIASRSSSYYLEYIPELNLIAIKNDDRVYLYDRSTYSFNSNTPLSIGVNRTYGVKIYYDQTRQSLMYLGVYQTSGASGSGNGYMDVYWRYAGNLGARNLLPSPVTKTSQNTMKLTYDLYIEY